MLGSTPHGPGNSTSIAPAHGAPQRSVLLVDDEATLRSALRRYFQRRGWKVQEAEDGEQARAMLLDAEVIGGGFDAVLTDMRMPRLTGIALHELVTQVDPRISRRFIFSSGDVGDEEAVAYLARTSCPLVQKPFELASLLAIVERIAAAGVSPASR